MKNFIKQRLSESITFPIIESLLDEDYPITFNMDEFKSLSSFNSRIKYCQEHLKRISSGSSRIVYMIDDEKVLKLAKNQKGIAQNEVEIEYSQYNDIESVVARCFDHHPNSLWVEMELAQKLTSKKFEQITGFKWDDYKTVIHNYGIDSGNGRGTKYKIDPAISDAMWEDEFTYSIFDFIGNYSVPVGDLMRESSYGIVKRDHGLAVVMIDYGLTSDVYTSYYS